METIRDLTWQVQLLHGSLERFDINDFQAVILGLSSHKKITGSAYRYRLLLFWPEHRQPVYAVNLETDLFGEWLLTEQLGQTYRILRRLSGMLSFEDFRLAAVELALERIATLKRPQILPKSPKATRTRRR